MVQHTYVRNSRSVAGVCLLALVAMLATTPAPTSGATQQVLARRAHTTLHATVRGPHGLLRSVKVFAFAHITKTAQPLRPAGVAKTGSRGRFSLRIGHTKRLKRYANHHKHRLNVDLVVFRRHHRVMLARAVTFRYSNSGVRLGKLHLRRIRHRTFRHGPKAWTSEDSAALKNRMPPEVGPGHQGQPTVLWVESAPDEVTNYTYAEDSASSMQAGYGINAESWGVSGTVTIEGTSGAEVGGTLKARHPLAYRYQAPLEVTQERSCTTVYGMPQYGYQDCTYETQARWIGTLYPRPGSLPFLPTETEVRPVVFPR